MDAVPFFPVKTRPRDHREEMCVARRKVPSSRCPTTHLGVTSFGGPLRWGWTTYISGKKKASNPGKKVENYIIKWNEGKGLWNIFFGGDTFSLKTKRKHGWKVGSWKIIFFFLGRPLLRRELFASGSVCGLGFRKRANKTSTKMMSQIFLFFWLGEVLICPGKRTT